MPVQVLLNIFIGFLWMLLQDKWSFPSFFAGYLVGIVILFFMRRFFSTSFYLGTFFSILKLLYVFLRELVSSTVLVLRQVTRRKIDVQPGVFAVKTDLSGEWEIPLLALLLSLTPGSVVLEISPDNKTFFIHAMDMEESKKSIIQAKTSFEKAIKEVTR
ncbi:monovalent cation/H+ antiporter subunit E [Bacillus sp. FJAT-27916]|uniref:Na+/H+ antiporter subunit E n=1 Tax=Bacillaceae TaxID=186817 RepID=UPI000670F519|nr:Na+/H+ antiporter subunit E [Bacillus sp. FJAT-27916]KMY43096.1 monovalent cation/H+ antiporter subunit E [Bacillus sp. FJAT-27916]